MFKRRKNSITLFATLITGLVSSSVVSAQGENNTGVTTKNNSESRRTKVYLTGKDTGPDSTAYIVKLSLFGLSVVGLTAGSIAVNNKINPGSKSSTEVAALENKIKWLEDSIEKLTENTSKALEKLNEINNEGKKQLTPETQRSYAAIIMYILISLVCATILVSVLVVCIAAYKAGGFSKLMANAAEKAFDSKLKEDLKKILNLVKEIADDPYQYLNKIYKEHSGADLENLFTQEEKLEILNIGKIDSNNQIELVFNKVLKKLEDKCKYSTKLCDTEFSNIINQITIAIITLNGKKNEIIGVVSKKCSEKLKKEELNNNSANSFEFILNEINNFIKENSGGSIDEIFSLANTLTEAANKGELFNFLLQQKIGQEKLEEVLVPTLNLVKDISRILTEKKEDNIEENKENEKSKIENKEEKKLPPKPELKIIVGNLTNLVASLEATLRKHKGSILGIANISSFIDDFKNAFNAAKDINKR